MPPGASIAEMNGEGDPYTWAAVTDSAQEAKRTPDLVSLQLEFAIDSGGSDW